MVAAVQTTDLCKSFGTTKALVGVDLAIEEGTVLGLLGPNGAGKTTIVRILATLLLPDSGQAVVGGVDVVAEPHRVRARIGLTGQETAVDHNLTGRENLQYIGQLCRLERKEARRRTNKLLEQFDLTEAGDRAVKTYSGGMRRRLDIAMSLIAEPAVVFLDEPTVGLDPRSRLAMWDFIAELTSGGTTILLTTQYLEEADKLADRIVVMGYGSVITEGTPSELKQRMGAKRIEVELYDKADASTVIDALTPFSIPGLSVQHHDRTVTVPVEEGARLLPQMVRAIDAADVRLRDVGVRQSTLDDVFLILTDQEAEKSPGTES